jgi:hypothetical protein
MGIKDFIKKKGVKLNIFKLRTQARPFEIEHNTRVEFQRHQVVHTLGKVEEFLLALKTNREFDDDVLDSLYNEVRARAFEILTFKS